MTEQRSYAEVVTRKAALRQIEAQRKLPSIEPQSFTAAQCGDPPFERSALGKRLLGISDEPQRNRGGWREAPKVTLPTRPFAV